MCLGATAIDGPWRLLEREAHHRLVHRANLLDVQRAIREALAVENQQVRSTRKTTPSETRGGSMRSPLLAARAVRPAFEKRIGVRIESRPCRAVNAGAVAAAVVDKPEQRQQLRPRAVARVHRVRIPRLVFAQPLEEARDRVVRAGRRRPPASGRGLRRRE